MDKMDMLAEMTVGYRMAAVRTPEEGRNYVVAEIGMHVRHLPTDTLYRLDTIGVRDGTPFPLFYCSRTDGKKVEDTANEFRGKGDLAVAADLVNQYWLFNEPVKPFDIERFGAGNPFTDAHRQKWEGLEVRVKTPDSTYNGTLHRSGNDCIRVGTHYIAHAVVNELKAWIPQPDPKMTEAVEKLSHQFNYDPILRAEPHRCLYVVAHRYGAVTAPAERKAGKFYIKVGMVEYRVCDDPTTPALRYDFLNHLDAINLYDRIYKYGWSVADKESVT